MNPTTVTLSNRYAFSTDDDQTFIGQGGMGSVYRGLDTTTNTPVAVKMLKSDLIARDADALQRFQLEGEALRQLNHPNIVKMLDAVEYGGVHYLIMEYVSGGSLRDVLENHPRLTIQRTLYTALDVADALTRAHRLRILHRDIKPDNVLIADDGTPRLTDFGMARIKGEPQITQDGAIVGTMAYLAPEAFHGEAPDERTDIWALGVMLYEMLAGQRPFADPQPATLIHAIMTKPVPDLEQARPDAPTALVDLIYRMLSKDRTARIPSVRLIGAEIEALIRGGTTTSHSPAVTVVDSTGRFEISTDGVTPMADTGASTARIKAPNNLSNPPTQFVGRERTLDALQQLVDDGNQLITLLGGGGVGKTRIALQFARQNLTRFSDGVYVVAMAGVDEPDFIIPTIAEQIDFTFGNDPQRDLIDFMRDKHLLLVIDNVEHLIDGANIIGEIANAAPDLTVIVTSRERLRLRGEQVFEIGGMQVPSVDVQSVTDIIGYPSVQLFLQSAHRVQPDFEIDTPATAECVAQIIRLVGGLPLGIELAAAWLEMLPLDEIVTEIENSLDFLETDLRDVPERHRSIRAVFEYSWNLMSENERDVFKKLSVFRGGFEREAAQKITGASLRNLTSLVNKSLISRNPDGRYYIQKLLRQYAEDRFHDDEDSALTTMKAFAEYYCAFIAKLAPAYNTSREKSAIEAIDKELENIRTMWHKVITYGHQDMLADGLETMHFYYIAHSMFYEGRAMFSDLAESLQAAGREDDLYWRARIRQAWIMTRLGQYEDVMRYAEGGLAHFDGEQTTEVAHALNQISYVYMMRGQLDESKAVARQALETVAVSDDKTAWFMAMGNLGYAHYLAGELRDARVLYEELMTLAPELDYSPTGIAYGHNNLGEILRDMGEVNRALELFKRAYKIFDSIKQKRGMAFSLNNIGGVVFIQGAYQEAKTYYQRAYDLNKEIGDRAGLAHSLSALGNVAVTQGDYDHAQKKYEESLRIRREMGDKGGIADSLADLARNALNQNQVSAARQYIEEAIQRYADIGDKSGEALSLAGRGVALLFLDELDDAERDLARALAIGQTLDSPMVLTQIYDGLGELESRRGNDAQAMDWFRKALANHNADETPLAMILFALMGVADLRWRAGDYQGALELVTLVLRYPRNFLGMVETRAAQLLDKLTATLDEQTIQTTMTESKSLVLTQVVTALLADDD